MVFIAVGQLPHPNEIVTLRGRAQVGQACSSFCNCSVTSPSALGDGAIINECDVLLRGIIATGSCPPLVQSVAEMLSR